MGEGVEGWQEGDRVVALPSELGGYGEYCLVEPHVGTVSVCSVTLIGLVVC